MQAFFVTNLVLCIKILKLKVLGLLLKGLLMKNHVTLFLVAFPIDSGTGLQKAFSDRILLNINAYKFENRLFSIVVSLQN